MLGPAMGDGQTHQVPKTLAKPVVFALSWKTLLGLSRILAVTAVVLLCGEPWTCLGCCTSCMGRTEDP